jgi:uncharacterized membrane protein
LDSAEENQESICSELGNKILFSKERMFFIVVLLTAQDTMLR